jgi:hypothetical protein
MSGTGAAKTPAFTVSEKKFTIRVACKGHGSVTVKTGDLGEAVPCDGTPRRVHVGTDRKTATVTITPSRGGSLRWTVAVVLTEDFKTVGPVTAPTWIAA